MKKGKNYEKYNKLIADKINEGIYKTPPDFDKIEKFAIAMSDLLFNMRADDVAAVYLRTPNTDENVPIEYINHVLDSNVHIPKIKDIIKDDIINHLTECPDDYKNEKGEYHYTPDVFDFAYALDFYIEQQYEDEHCTKTLLVCPNCKSDNVQVKMWVNANTNEVIDSASDEGDDDWCEDCQGHYKLDSVTLKPRAKVIGFQVRSIDGIGDAHIHTKMEASFCVYNLSQAREMLNDVEGTTEYNELMTIWEGDIEEPTMMFEGDPRD